MPKIDLVTVFFGLEIPFMEIQALSIDKCFNRDLVNKVIVIINEPSVEQEEKTALKFEELVRPRYGQFADKVIVIKASHFGTLSDKGWLTQQGCKLAAAKHCSSEYYLVLDAKNHAIRLVDLDTVFDANGIPVKIFTKTRQDQRPWLDASFSFFDQENLIPNYRCPSSAPPFPINAKVGAELVDFIEGKEGKDILSFFIDKDDVSTEFTLYVAYLAKLGIFCHHFSNGASSYVSLRGKIDKGKISSTKEKLEDKNVWCFSVHRRAFRNVRERTLETIAKGWSVFLFSSYDEAYANARLLGDKLSEVKDFNDLREMELKG